MRSGFPTPFITAETRECNGLTDATTLISACALIERAAIKVDVRRIDLIGCIFFKISS